MVRYPEEGKVREIDEIILHCSATREGVDVSAEVIRNWHTTPPRNWSDIGYHYVIELDGTVKPGREIYRQGAGVRGHNKTSVHICYVGGLDVSGHPKNTLTQEQKRSIKRLCYALSQVLQRPLSLTGHREYAKKACPSFEVSEVFADLQRRLAAPWEDSY